MRKKIEISIVIVHYHVKKELHACIDSILSARPRQSFEIIVVDNDEVKELGDELYRNYPFVHYIPTEKNVGWGGGTNIGVANANGKYIYFLNPDTRVSPEAIDRQYKFITSHTHCGVVAAEFVDEEGNIHKTGTAELTPFRAIFALSFLHKILPQNSIAKQYWLIDWDRCSPKAIPAVPLAAAIMKNDIFDKVGGFDEHFFLYFEEYDLSQKLARYHLTSYIIPQSRVVHAWGSSTKQNLNIAKIFTRSRYLYFKKYYGFLPALLTEAFLRMTISGLIFTGIILMASSVRLYSLNDLIPFIGDQGWFYLSARDSIMHHIVPLVSIPSSHPWLHQGPYWTYILMVLFSLSHFDPIVPAYFTVFCSILTIYLLYRFSREMFDTKIALVASFIYATSPLVVFHARFPYHTSLIPLFSLLTMYSVYKWIQGNTRYAILVSLCLGILYNFELATQILWVIVGMYVLLGTIQRKLYITEILQRKKIILLAVLAYFIPLIPVLIYDATHRFVQTVGFAFWMLYQPIKLFLPHTSSSPLLNFWQFIYDYNARLIFPTNAILALIVFFLTLGMSVFGLINKRNPETVMTPGGMVTSFAGITIALILLSRVPSEAYLPMLFPSLLLLIAYIFVSFAKKRMALICLIFIVIIMGFMNIQYLFRHSYFMGKGETYGPTLTNRLAIVSHMIKISNGQPFSIKGNGRGSQFPSYTMNYAYLLWLKGNSPVENSNLLFIINDDDGVAKFVTIKK